MKFTHLATSAAILALAACGEPANAPPVEQAPPAQSTEAPVVNPGDAYPSLQGDANAPTPPVNESGRGSAQTGATGGATQP